MAIFYTPRIQINGVVDTSATVLTNLNEIANNSQCFLTWDPTTGKWTVKLNRPETTTGIPLFNDSNIIGSINVTHSSVDSVYNSVRIDFPHKDLRDGRDELVYSVPLEDRFERELDNELSLSTNLINDPVQASLIANIELKQSRLDKIVEFKTNYQNLDLQVGDLFRLQNDIYYWNNNLGEVFRAINIEEVDEEDGGILLSITGLEYDGNVYSEDGLVREEKNLNSGIEPATNNVCVIEEDAKKTASDVADALQTDEGRAAITSVGIPVLETASLNWSTSEVLSVFGNGTETANGGSQLEAEILPYLLTSTPAPIYSDSIRTATNALVGEFTTNNTIKTLSFDFVGAQGVVNYAVSPGGGGSIAAGIPIWCSLFYSAPSLGGSSTGPWVQLDFKYMEWSSYITKFDFEQILVDPPVHWLFLAGPLVTYDLTNNTNNVVKIISVSSVFASASGSGATATIKLFQN